MGDYISRDDFAKHLDDIQYGEAPTGRTGENIDYQKGVYAGFDMAYVALKRFPAADVRPVVRGQDVWNTVTEHHCEFKCSICGEEIREHWGEDFNFCPYCGADMREETDA